MCDFMLVGCLSALYIWQGSINKLFYFMRLSMSDLVGWVIVYGFVDEDKIWQRYVESMVTYGY